MAQFCETCPSRGTCKPDVELRHLTLTLSIGRKTLYATQMLDRESNGSEIFITTDPNVKVFTQIENCQHPVVQKRGLVRKKEVEVCGGLEGISMTPKDSEVVTLFRRIQPETQRINRELWDEI